MAREIENALRALRDANAQAAIVADTFNVRCAQFVKDCRDYMAIDGGDALQIGDNCQGVHIPLTGRVTWYGITTSAILEGYEKQLLEMIKKQTEAVIEKYKRFC
ncbi:MAG: hypothetical protein J6Y02_20180 [Pseudobutyrivibrio sp.]|nr:hypothetical protein [Pseudobutyrivibrio sp.]